MNLKPLDGQLEFDIFLASWSTENTWGGNASHLSSSKVEADNQYRIWREICGADNFHLLSVENKFIHPFIQSASSIRHRWNAGRKPYKGGSGPDYMYFTHLCPEVHCGTTKTRDNCSNRIGALFATLRQVIHNVFESRSLHETYETYYANLMSCSRSVKTVHADILCRLSVHVKGLPVVILSLSFSI